MRTLVLCFDFIESYLFLLKNEMKKFVEMKLKMKKKDGNLVKTAIRKTFSALTFLYFP